MTANDAYIMENHDPKFREDAPDGDAAREAQAAVDDAYHDMIAREVGLDVEDDETPEPAEETTGSDDDGSDPFAGWVSYSPPDDAYLRPEPPAARLMCADGKARLLALSAEVVGRGGRL